MNRRTFLTAAAAVFALPVSVIDNPFQGIEGKYVGIFPVGKERDEAEAHVESLSVKLSDRLFVRHPDLFSRERQMTAPVDEIDGVKVEALTRVLGARYNVEFQYDGSCGDEIEEELCNIMADEIAGEFRRVVAQTPMTIYPYRLVNASISVDRHTFAPCITFKTRYGSIPA